MEEQTSKPKISVIMPVYNADRYLDKSIQSILNQTFKDFEFIIVNDCSKDNSKEIIEKYKKKDKRIILINNSKNLGVQKALNRGLRVAKGKYIARMDGDDISHPERIEKQFNYLERNNHIFLVGSSAIVINEMNGKIGLLSKYDNIRKTKRKLLKSNTLVHPSIMFRNTQEFFYREKFKSSEDYDFYLRILSSGRAISNIETPLVKYRISRDSFVSTMPNQEYYFKKAKEFYYQRIKLGKDDYGNLSFPKENSFPKNYERDSFNSIIFIQLLYMQGKKMRKNINLYAKKYGMNGRLILCYILSFFPRKFIKFMQENFF